MKQDTRLIAMYLPQFHRVKENDEWWGEGFTEWSAVQGATPLFEGHDQPRVPLDGNYYNLLDKKVMEWQASLMHKYGIDGICIYHYWFKEGRKILERPAENLLRWDDIDLPYCFCWANETWARSWSKLSGKNTWASKFEKNAKDKKELLLEQDYGGKEEWKAHFEYLLPFLNDKRYICIDNKPVILIYRSSDIICLREMVSLWRNMAIEAGLQGLYVIGGNCKSGMKSILDGQLHHEPQRSIHELHSVLESDGKVVRLDYKSVWEGVLRADKEYGMQPYFEGFVGFDDTPRRGVEGIALVDNAPQIFEEMLERLLKKNMDEGSELVFLNAWNEWGEGMYLEPDECYGEEYLKAVFAAKQRACQIQPSGHEKKSVPLEMYQGLQVLQKRKDIVIELLAKWLALLEDGICLADYIENKFAGEVAIYGYGLIGKILHEEFKKHKFPVKYIIDKNAAFIHVDIPVYRFEDDIPAVDNIIVTAQYYFDEIYGALQEKKMDCRIVSIGEILDSIR